MKQIRLSVQAVHIRRLCGLTLQQLAEASSPDCDNLFVPPELEIGMLASMLAVAVDAVRLLLRLETKKTAVLHLGILADANLGTACNGMRRGHLYDVLPASDLIASFAVAAIFPPLKRNRLDAAAGQCEAFDQ